MIKQFIVVINGKRYSNYSTRFLINKEIEKLESLSDKDLVKLFCFLFSKTHHLLSPDEINEIATGFEECDLKEVAYYVRES